MGFNFEREVLDVCIVYRLSGDMLTREDSAQLQQAVVGESHPVQIILHAGNLNHVTSSGLNTFIHLLTIVRNKGGELVISDIPERLRRLLVITKLEQIFLAFQGQDMAIKHFQKLL